MNIAHRFVVGLTLALFVSQSFAILHNSCQLSGFPASKTVSKEIVSVYKPGGETHHSSKHRHTVFNTDFQKFTSKSICESEHHSCDCSAGTCSVHYLPASNKSSVPGNEEFPGYVLINYVNFQPALWSPPPIST